MSEQLCEGCERLTRDEGFPNKLCQSYTINGMAKMNRHGFCVLGRHGKWELDHKNYGKKRAGQQKQVRRR